MTGKNIIIPVACLAAVFAFAACVRAAEAKKVTVIDVYDRQMVAQDTAAVQQDNESGEKFFVKLDGEGMSVMSGEGECELILQAEIDASALRQADRDMLEKGITADNYEEVLKLLEDFTS